MERRFWSDPYLSELDAVIESINGRDVTINPTIIFAESGGQESDRGTINNIPVSAALITGDNIVYTLESDPDFGVGETVPVAIDWDRRYALMRLHFAAELVLELFYKKFSGVEKIGAHIAEDKARIDFIWSGNISEVFEEIQTHLDRIVSANSPIESRFSDEDRLRRVWRIEGFSEVPCGGTHLRETGEVGRLALKRKNIGKGKERVEIYLV